MPHLVNWCKFQPCSARPDSRLIFSFLLSPPVFFPQVNWKGSDPCVRRLARSRSCPLETDDPGQRERKKQLKVPNRLLTCHKTKQVLHIKLWVFILLSTSSSHPFHYVSRGVFAAENVTWVSIKQKQKKILRRAKTNGRIKRNPLKKIR